jgi:stage IV sporulation protein FB
MAIYRMQPEFEYRPAGWRAFSLFGIPVYIEGGFLFLLLFYFLTGAESRQDIPRIGLWCFVVFLSIVVHEFGHAIVARLSGCSGIRIALVMFGGLAYHSPTSRGRSILISLAGPFFGFLLGALAYVLFEYTPLPYEGPPATIYLLSTLVLVNIFWTIFNLLPMHPLDGGQTLFYALTYKLSDDTAMLWTARVSLIVAALVGFWGYQNGYLIISIICLFVGMQNFRQAGLLQT